MENLTKVILADANEEFRILLEDTIEKTGEFTVVGSTGNGAELMEMVHQLQPQMVIMDLILPGLDGFGVLSQLQTMDDSMPKVFVTSNFSNETTVSRAMDLGVYFFLPKPVSEQSLLEQMRKAAAPQEELAVQEPVTAYPMLLSPVCTSP